MFLSTQDFYLNFIEREQSRTYSYFEEASPREETQNNQPNNKINYVAAGIFSLIGLVNLVIATQVGCEDKIYASASNYGSLEILNEKRTYYYASSLFWALGASIYLVKGCTDKNDCLINTALGISILATCFFQGITLL